MVSRETKIIRLPKLLTIGWSHILFKALSEAIHYKGRVTFDFENVQFAAPFGLTAVSTTLSNCLAQGKSLYYSPPKNKKLRDYLDRIGFRYHFLRGKEASHRKTSVELKHLMGVDPGCSEALVDLIAMSMELSEDAQYEMRTHLNELMTNAFDHSKSKSGSYVCAQWYPTKKNLRISFADSGIGILGSLRESGKFPDVRTDLSAIKLAVKPGVTTRKKQLGGFGLDYIRKYVRHNEGTLTIISGRAKINFYKNKIENKVEPVPYHGTIVDIRVSPKKEAGKSERKRDDLF